MIKSFHLIYQMTVIDAKIRMSPPIYLMIYKETSSQCRLKLLPLPHYINRVERVGKKKKKIAFENFSFLFQIFFAEENVSLMRVNRST